MARSANLDFFAAEADQRAVFDYLFSATDVRVFESYSEFGAASGGGCCPNNSIQPLILGDVYDRIILATSEA
jgi:hypothetical protein